MNARPGAPRLVRPLLAAFLAAAALDLAGLLAGWDTAHLIAKPLLMPLLAALAAARGGPRTLIAALLCGWGGDVLLMPDSDTAFLAGMGCFAAGHLCYLRLFGRTGAPLWDRASLRDRTSLRAGAGYAVVLTVFVAALWSGLPAGMRIPMTCYGLLLATMAWRAGTPGRRTAAGGALFLLSDALIAAGVAGLPGPPAHDFWIMLTYLAAQYLLTTGILACGNDSTRGVSRAYGEGSTRTRPR
ncbi:lysoplasmalogenase [Streptomyces nitrosporeus]|uniref:lysoplasmalogenase n=1 Tax=Streptomyces nitrosporeus TaxID=28894 RepID=UPI00399FEB7A